MSSSLESRRRLNGVFAVLLLSVLSLATPALSVDCMWGNGLTDNWNEPSAWSCNQVPGPGDTASQINGTITLTEAASVDSFLMQGGVVTGDADLLALAGRSRVAIITAGVLKAEMEA